jgi:hypothetical protein
MFVSNLNSYWHENLALYILYETQVLVSRSAHRAVQFLLHAFNKTFNMNYLFTTAKSCQCSFKRVCTYWALVFHYY